MAQIKARRKRQREAAQRRSSSTTCESHPCVDCGETDIVVLEFDHLRDKTASNVSYLISTNEIRRIKEEIEKCEVVLRELPPPAHRRTRRLVPHGRAE